MTSLFARCAGLVGCALLLAPGIAFGQAAEPAPSGSAASGGAGINVALEVFFIIVLFAAALFAVCKGSRRQ